MATTRSESGRLTSLLRLYPALGVPPFLQLWVGTLFGTFSWQMGIVATGYTALVISGSASALGAVSLASGLPMLLLSLVAGVVADRFSRRLVLASTLLLFFSTSTLLAVLYLTGNIQVWHLVAISFLQGSGLSFYVPSRQALSAELVDRSLLRNAVALNSAGMNASRVAGPGLGGLLVAAPFIGAGGVFAFQAGLFLLSSFLVLRIKNPAAAAPQRKAAVHTSGWSDMLEGVRYIAASPRLLVLLGLAIGPVLFGLSYITLLPLFAEQVFQVGASGLGVLMGSAGFGALIGAIVVAGLTSHAGASVIQLGFGVAMGLALILFAYAPSFLLAVPLIMLVGFCSSAYNSMNNALVMAQVDPRLYGRVMSVYMLSFAAAPVAALPAAIAADVIGGPNTVAILGAITASIVAGVAVFVPAVRQIR